MPPGQSYLMRRYRISAEEAAERLSLESEISRLAAELAGSEDDFASIWIEHEPVYRIVVAFAGAEDRAYVRDRVSPRMRRYVQIRNVAKSRRQLESDIDAIIASVQQSGIDYVAYYDHRTDMLVVEVAENDQVNTVRELIPPRLRSTVRVQRGSLPQPMQVSGAQPGDSIAGGWWYYASSTTYQHSCSFAFTGRNNVGRAIILTAAHCEPQYWVQETGHMVQLSAPLAEWGTGKYDYQFHDVTGLTTGPWVWYDNNSITVTGYTHLNNNVPGYGEEGYFRVVGSRGYYDQLVGQTLCKSGRSTGFTCGQIIHGYYTWHGVKGWIQFGLSDQDILLYKGDSGGAVFAFDPNPGDVIALGIISGANVINLADGSTRPCLESDTVDCYGVHMPIDYIDDQQLLTLDIASQQ